MTDLTNLGVAELRDGLKNKDFTATELAHATQEKIHKSNDKLNAFVTITDEQAFQGAKKADDRIAAGDATDMTGVPVGIKDLFCTKGVLTTGGSHILDGFTPEYESKITQKLWDAGAVMPGKTNLDEFAMGSANITSYYGNVINPWNAGDGKDRVPGGSSGGSAAAVAAGLVPAALGTDTGGSIRQPASFCGIVGVKPTYGRCSRWGTIAFASSLDQAGVFARSVEDAAIVQQTISGYDKMDSTSANRLVEDFASHLGKDIKGMKIGIPKEYRMDGMPSEIEALWQQGAKWLQEQGAEIIDISLPHTKYALPTYYVIAPAECSSNLSRYDGVRYGLRVMDKGDNLDAMYEKTRAAGFGDEVKRRIMIGTYVLSAGYYDAYYKKAQRVRTLIAQDFAKAYEKVDAILTPTAPSSAFAIGEKQDDPIAMYLNDIFTVPASLAGLPGMSIPAGLDSQGLPLGLQVLAPAFDEMTMFKVASALEQAAQFNAKPAKVAA
ncbi:MAG: Asp-tRNA(Asn)/Glu-tRNA(Gln) amidotransferase subunit GatA [Rickettsiales bacterium]|nr:Asp-tRNA(Asn)/Glu-tRNA(Gln) amidotransferase subunit GatA [Rickettsiales bacterium]